MIIVITHKLFLPILCQNYSFLYPSIFNLFIYQLIVFIFYVNLIFIFYINFCTNFVCIYNFLFFIKIKKIHILLVGKNYKTWFTLFYFYVVLGGFVLFFVDWIVPKLCLKHTFIFWKPRGCKERIIYIMPLTVSDSYLSPPFNFPLYFQGFKFSKLQFSFFIVSYYFIFV